MKSLLDKMVHRRGIAICLACILIVAGCARRPARPGPGERIVIHKVREGETLQQISEDYFGTPDRAGQIKETNSLSGEELEEGTILRIVLKKKDMEFLELRKAARMPYNEGLDLTAHGDYLKALGKFREALEIDAGFIEARYNLGVTYQKMKAYDKALAHFEEAVRKRPDNSGYLFALGNCLFHLKNCGEAAETFVKVLDLEPNHLKARFSLAAAYEKLGNRERAKEAWLEYLRFDNDSAWAAEARKRLEKLKK